MRTNQRPVRATPRFVTKYAKAQIVEDVLRALEEEGINQSGLAKRLGTTRQYVSEIIREKANLSIQSLAELAGALEWQLIVRLIHPDEAMPVVPTAMLPKIRTAVFEDSTNPVQAITFEDSDGTYDSVGGHRIRKNDGRNPLIPRGRFARNPATASFGSDWSQTW